MYQIKLGLLIGLPIYIILVFFLIKRKNSIKNFIIYSIFYFYIVGLISVTFIANSFGGGSLSFKITNYINLIPFKVFYDDLILLERGLGIQAFKQTFGNFILLTPAGFFIPLIWEKINFSYKKAFFCGLIISFSIEILQLFITFILRSHYKSFDIDDIILNTLGFVLGFSIYKNRKKIIKFLKIFTYEEKKNL